MWRLLVIDVMWRLLILYLFGAGRTHARCTPHGASTGSSSLACVSLLPAVHDLAGRCTGRCDVRFQNRRQASIHSHLACRREQHRRVALHSTVLHTVLQRLQAAFVDVVQGPRPWAAGESEGPVGVQIASVVPGYVSVACPGDAENASKEITVDETKIRGGVVTSV